MSAKFGYGCEYCKGTVRAKRMDREAFRHKRGFVILEGPTIGVCDRCGSRYYSAETLLRVDEIAKGIRRARRTESVPVASAR